MKANAIKHYPLFIFTSENFCLQTADHDLLKFVFESDGETVKTSFKIGEEMLFKMEDGGTRKFKIINISIDGVVEDIELNQIGIISYGCTQTIGKQKDESMFLHIEMTELDIF